MADWKAPNGAEAGLEEMRISALSDWLGTCSIAFVPAGRTAVVTRVAAGEARERLAGLGVVRGISLVCVRHEADRVVVQLPSGEQTGIDRRDAWVLQVAPPKKVTEWPRNAGQETRGRTGRWVRGRLRREL